MFITTCFKFTVSKEEKEQILKLMRNFSSAVRFSYKRFLEGFTTLQAYTITKQKFPELNSHYVNCAVEKAREIFQSCKARGQNLKKLIFGVRALFEKLKKNYHFSYPTFFSLCPVMVQGGVAGRLGPDGSAVLP
jgi:predicted transposase